MIKQEGTVTDPALARTIEALKSCKGYNAQFIDGKKNIKANLLSREDQQLLPQLGAGRRNALHYTNLSVYLNTNRRMAFYSAYNIDGGTKTTVERKLDFITDPRIEADFQLTNAFYNLRKGRDNPDFDKGHMAANNEMAWGSGAQERANQTFFHTNACPQVASLNRGLWKSLETYFIKESMETVKKKICVFSGPVLRRNDPPYIDDPDIRLPLHFFKVVVFKYGKKFYSTAFLFSQKKALQELKLIEEQKQRPEREAAKTPFEDFAYEGIFQVDVKLVADLTRIDFTWSGVQALSIPDSKKKLENIDAAYSSEEAEELLGGRQPESNRMDNINTRLGFVFPE